jgi:hypothetical protein
MNRRGFLRLLGLGVAGAVADAELDLERLLWVPKPMITVPALPSGVVQVSLDEQFGFEWSEAHLDPERIRKPMRFATNDMITRLALERLETALQLNAIISRQYDDDFKFVQGDQWSEVTRRGRTIRIRKPERVTINDKRRIA